MPIGISPLATAEVERRRDVANRSLPVFGIAVHCTGSGIVARALKERADPFEYAMAYYLRPKSYFAHYVVGFDGTIAQVADEHERAPHIGLAASDRATYLRGKWRNRLPKAFVDRWSSRWAGRKSPSHLYPGPSPNDAYVGIELLVWVKGCEGVPHGPRMKYTTAQHDAAAALSRDVAERWSLPTGWHRSARLACHEDINPLTRSKNGAGWDPGVIRADPWFDWNYFLDRIEGGPLVA